MSTGQLNRHQINDLLRDREISKTEFGRKLDVTPQTVSSWLAGRTIPSMTKIVEMTHILDVPLNVIWTTDDESHLPADSIQIQDMYEKRLHEIIANQPEHVKAKILAIVAEEIAAREKGEK